MLPASDVRKQEAINGDYRESKTDNRILFQPSDSRHGMVLRAKSVTNHGSAR